MIYGPKKNAAFTFYLPLVTKGGTDWKDAPTLAAGDVQVKKDAGAFGNITTLPALDAAGEKVVKVALTAGEINGDVVVVRFIDQTNPKEWEDTGMVIITTAQGVGLQSGDAYARVGAPAGASVSADVAAVKGDTAAVKLKTDNLPADPADASDLVALCATLQADTDDIQTRLPAALVGGKMDSAVADKTGFKLAADGLDAIAATNPTGVPTTFPGWVMWVVGRFRRARMRKTGTGTAVTEVLKGDGTVATSQAMTDDGTTQAVGEPS